MAQKIASITIQVPVIVDGNICEINEEDMTLTKWSDNHISVECKNLEMGIRKDNLIKILEFLKEI